MRRFIIVFIVLTILTGCKIENSFVYNEIITTNYTSYLIETTPLDEVIDYSFDSEDISFLQNKEIFSYKGSKIFLSVLPVQNNWEVHLKFVGNVNDNEFTLVSVEDFSNNALSNCASVYLTNSLSGKENSSRHWNGYSLNEDGLDIFYNLFLSSSEKDKAQETHFDVNLHIKNLVCQTIKKKG